MKISTRARYAIRMILDIAANSKNGEPVGLKATAERQGLSKRYLEQLAIPLKNATILRSVRGKEGGYKLAKPASEIKIGDITSAVIGPI
ncbi:MAG: Rrf2 family transcriptional regulator, partial [bacterium]